MSSKPKIAEARGIAQCLNDVQEFPPILVLRSLKKLDTSVPTGEVLEPWAEYAVTGPKRELAVISLDEVAANPRRAAALSPDERGPLTARAVVALAALTLAPADQPLTVKPLPEGSWVGTDSR